MSNTLTRGILLLAAVSLTGCADRRPISFYWERPNTTELETFKENYHCMKTNQEGYSTTRVDSNIYGHQNARANSGVELNRGLYIACMLAKGFTKVDVPNPDFKMRLNNNFN